MQISAIEKQDKKLVKGLRRAVWQAQEDFGLITSGDKVMVCMSGGKDSYTLLDMVLHMQKVRQDFEIIAVNLDQKQPGYPEDILPTYLEEVVVDYRILERDTYSIVKEKIPEGKTMCSLCSRLRRGTLYTAATELGVTKIALGHHREDVLETFFLNLFFSGKLESMPPIYRTDDQQHVVIRPLVFCKESDIATYAQMREFPIIPCTLCGSQDGLQRQVIKEMLNTWEKKYPDRKEIIMNALGKIHPSHLYDKQLFDFDSLKEKLGLIDTLI